MAPASVRTAMIVILILAASICGAEDLVIGRFSCEGLDGWEQKSFKGKTDYHIVQEGGKQVVKAQSNGTASGLIKKVRFDPAKFRTIKWSWKIGHPVAKSDEKTKGGDDFAARVYVVFPGTMFWQTKAINYIWASKLPKGESYPNPYTRNAMMVVLQSGESHAGEWIHEERDILADYKKLFGSAPSEGSAIAIMTDSDNTTSSATAWYGDITLTTGH